MGFFEETSMSTSHSNSLDEFVTLASNNKSIQIDREVKIAGIFNEFCNNIAQVQLYQGEAKDMANKKLSKLSEYDELLKEKPELENNFFDRKNMFFRNAENGDLMRFGHIKRNLEDIKEAVILHQNRQYQLFLAEAYEAFGDFIKDAYAGYIDKNLWSNDLKDISPAEINENSFEFFRKMIEKLKYKRNKTKGILNRLKESFPEISELEKENKLNINLWLVITLIEKIRHTAVHDSGKVKATQQDFIETILNDSGLDNSGNLGEKHPEFSKLIQSLFRDGYLNTLIVLLELDLFPGGNSAYKTIFNDLCDYLMTYAYIFFNCLEAHQKQNISQL